MKPDHLWISVWRRLSRPRAAVPEGTEMARRQPERGARGLAFAAAHLTVLTSFALAQPLFDLLGRNPEFFIAHESTPAELIGFALAVTFVVPLAVILVELAANLVHGAVRAAIHLAGVGFLAGIVILHAAANGSGAASSVLIPVAALGGSAFAVAYHFARPVRSFLTILAPAPFVFLGLFLLNGQIAKLVMPGGNTAPAAVVEARTPVVLVIFDEFPVVSLMDEREQIDRVRYPNFAALADDAIWFRNATSVSEDTAFAGPAILAGKRPKPDQLPLADDYPETVFTLLGRSYDISAFMPFSRLCPPGLCDTGEASSTKARVESLLSDVSVAYGHLVLPEDLRQKLPSVEGTWRDFRGAERSSPPEKRAISPEASIRARGGPTRTALRASLDERARTVESFLASLRRTRRPTLHVLHMMYPHRPFDRMPSGRSYAAGRRMEGMGANSVWQENEFLVRQSWQRHLLQVAFTDGLVGEIVRRLERIGIYDRALVIFTADHGASFWPGHGFRRVDEIAAPGILFVPLFVKLPHGERGGTIVDRHAATIDVLPTIVDVLDADLDWRFDGHSLLDGGTDRVSALVKDGTSWTAPLEELKTRRREHVKRKAEIFGTGSDRPGLFGVGPNSELVGRAPSDLPSVSSRGIEAKFDQPRDLRSVDPDTGYVPAWITGTIEAASVRGPLDLAISLNGRIVAVGESFRRSREAGDRFAFVVPEAAFRPGPNDARVYWVRTTPDGLSLSAIGCAGCD